MSRYDYDASKRIAVYDPPFEALIMAAMRQADTANLIKLQAGWPDVWAELDERYNTPGAFTAAELAQGEGP